MLTCPARGPPWSSRPADPCARIAAGSCADNVAANNELDADPMLLNVLNGTIDLRTGEIRPFRREDYITCLAPVTYDPDARSSLWERFLDEATDGDVELQEYLRAA